MSEQIHSRGNRANVRNTLLATACAAALLTYLYSAGEAKAADADQPQIWIELGGQFEQIKTQQEAFVPPFSGIQPEISSFLPGNVQISPADFQKPQDYSFGSEGAISFEPEGSDWVFSAAIRFGRSSGGKHVHQATAPKPDKIEIFTGFTVTKTFYPSEGKFSDAKTKKSESHEVLDFQAGKDVGLGMFGGKGNSTISAGLRFAQFNSGMHATFGSGPEPFQYKYFGAAKLPQFSPHEFLGKVQTTRSFHGFGPSASWEASAPVAGNTETAELTFDWGVNAALLFGRQKAKVHHQTTGFYVQYASRGGHPLADPLYLHPSAGHPTAGHETNRSVTVPDVGGMLGMSLKWTNAKISLGYRADWFFGAMDGGLDARKNENIGFHGPFASVSVGLGD